MHAIQHISYHDPYYSIFVLPATWYEIKASHWLGLHVRSNHHLVVWKGSSANLCGFSFPFCAVSYFFFHQSQLLHLNQQTVFCVSSSNQDCKWGTNYWYLPSWLTGQAHTDWEIMAIKVKQLITSWYTRGSKERRYRILQVSLKCIQGMFLLYQRMGTEQYTPCCRCFSMLQLQCVHISTCMQNCICKECLVFSDCDCRINIIYTRPYLCILY